MNSIPRNSRRAVFSSSIGTILEWYDFFAYGTAAALVFPQVFFPKVDQFASMLASMAVFGMGFFARPVGGIIFAHLGDRIGRKKCLATTLTLMGGATLGIGLLPAYATIGVAAPLLLVCLRLVQGVALGGEYGAAVLFVTENVPARQVGFFSSWTQASVPAGMLLSTAVFAATQFCTGHASLADGDWRIVFIFGGVAALAGVYVRVRLFETAEFSRITPVRRPVVQVFVRARREIIGAIMLRLPENASYYLVTVFLVSFGATHGGLDRTFLLRCLLVGSAVQFISILLFGRLTDWVGPRPVLLAGILAVVPCFWLVTKAISSGTHSWLLAAFALFLGFGHALLYAPQAAYFAKLFPVEVRYSGISVVTQVSAVLAGGIAPFIGAYLTRGSNLTNLVVYVIGLAAIGLVGWLIIPNARGQER